MGLRRNNLRRKIMSKRKYIFFHKLTCPDWKYNVIKVKLPKGIKDIGDYLLSQGEFANAR